MTSKEVKEILMDRFTFANGYVGAVYEAPNLNSADVIAVRHGGNIQEFEIKVSKADLVGEMRCARVAKGLDDLRSYMRRPVQLAIDGSTDMTDEQRGVLREYGHTLSKTKLDKHRMYLTEVGREVRHPYGLSARRPFVPNTFYWCVPSALVDICRQLNKGLPYGIYVFDLAQTERYHQKFIVKGCRSLTAQGDRVYFELFNRASTLLQEARWRARYFEGRVAEDSEAPKR